ncbi:hypothetical protein FRB96_000781 [Tulasnella sp. 330]|nr:hypothetical protein FRB96_000781 [Tulasnella sp. 330]KAG8882530.1 hypothetical protein FRB97_008156 [Tulasnella sp. 331]KAG8888863.1 hypothetical protein FRB98_006649 [Tulasnella sp. 332]
MSVDFDFFKNPLKTREDLQRAAISLLDPLALYTSPKGARVHLGYTATHYDEIAAQLEGFTRPLWGLASLLAGGGEYPGHERWVRGFDAGTDPASDEFWGYTRGKDQRMVEMSPIGFALAMAPEQLYQPLSQQAKANLIKWLGAINGKDMPDTNWLWFRVFANLGLSKIGAPFSQEQLKADLDHLDTFYLGDGWSRDGPPGVNQLDYYSGSFAIQYAQLVYSKLAKDEDPKRCEEYRERARKFAITFVHWFDEDGRSIPFGRSLTYRFAMASFWGALAFADVEVPGMSWGVVKGMLLRHIRYWTTQPGSFTRDGTFTIGYTYPNMNMTEAYNSPGSPYWAFKSFIPLALPSSHPFWTADEELFPLASIPHTFPAKHPGHIHTHLGGHTFLLSSGQSCHYPLRAGAEKYGKLCYSTAFGYAVPVGTLWIDQHAPDCAIALSEDGGVVWKVRRECDDARLEFASVATGGSSYAGCWLRAVWRPWKDVEVETILVPPHPDTPLWHLRIHRLKTGRELLSSDAGFSNYGQRKDGRALDLLKEDAFLSTPGSELVDGKIVSPSSTSETAWALVSSEGGVVGIRDFTSPEHSVETGQEKRTSQVIALEANTNIVFARSVMPTIMGHHLPHAMQPNTQDSEWLVTGIFAIPSRVGEKGVAKAKWIEEWKKVPKIPEDVLKLMAA